MIQIPPMTALARFFIPFLLLLTLGGCKYESKLPNIQILNSSDAVMTVKIDDEPIDIPPHTAKLHYKRAGDYTLEFGGKTFPFEMIKDKKLLINPGGDTILVQEMAYVKDRLYNTTAEYKLPNRVIMLGDKKFLGHFRLSIGEMFVPGWDFALDEAPPNSVGLTGYVILDQIYVKIATLSEVKKTFVPLNTITEWVAQSLPHHVHNITEGYRVEMKSGFVLVIFPNGDEIDIGKGTVDNADVLELHHNLFYDPEMHGKITKRVATLENFFLVHDSTRRICRKAEVVLSDKHHQPHVRPLQ